MAVRRVYIAGPMRGVPRFNFPEFDAAAERFRVSGWDVVNPAELDRQAGIDENNPELPPDFMRGAMARDLSAICDCTAIALLPGWEKSSGVGVELALARLLNLEILNAGTALPLG